MYDFSIRCACEDPNMLTGVQFSLLMYRYLKDGNKSVSKVIFLEKKPCIYCFLMHCICITDLFPDAPLSVRPSKDKRLSFKDYETDLIKTMDYGRQVISNLPFNWWQRHKPDDANAGQHSLLSTSPTM